MLAQDLLEGAPSDDAELPRLDAVGTLMSFLREHARVFVYGLATSLLIEGLIIGESHFLLAGFGIELDFPTLLVALVGTDQFAATETVFPARNLRLV
jgi:hypothetical protein